MRVTDRLATCIEYPELVSLEERMAALRAHVDGTYAHACANLEAQHSAVNAEIAALSASMYRLQTRLSERWDAPSPRA